jgi:Zn-dependent protease with chaperone function
MRVLTESELAAVVGHEFGHFKGEDTAYSLRFVPIYSGLTRALQGLSRPQGTYAIALLPARAALRFFIERFAAAERSIGRQREIEADRVGASVGGADALASALVKASTFGPLWELVGKTMTSALNEGKSLINASLYFSESIVTAVAPRVDAAKLSSEIATSRLSHPTDTHPPLSERFAALGVPMSDPAKLLALDGRPSLTLIANATAIEQKLTEQLAALYVALGRARLPKEKSDAVAAASG